MGYQPKSYRKFLATSVGAVMAASSILPVAASAASNGTTSFTDVTSEYAPQVNYVVSKGIKGHEDGTFGVNGTVDRTHAAIFLADVLGLTVPTTVTEAPFKDVPANSMYANYVKAVKDAGVFKGSDGNFGPNDVLTREQMASVIVNAYPQLATDSAAATQVTVGDIASVAATHKANVQVLANLGITKLPNGNYNPKGDISRLQFASLLYQVDQYLNAKTPAVTSVSAINGSQIKVTFSAPLDETSATTVANYSVVRLSNDVTYSINNAELSADGKSVILTANAAALASKADYSITAKGIKFVDSGSKSYNFADVFNAGEDKTAPSIDSVSATTGANGTSTVLVTFNESVDTAGLKAPVFKVNDQVVAATQNPLDAREFTLTLPSSVAAGTSLEVNATGVYDLAGNNGDASETASVASDLFAPKVSKVEALSDTQVKVTFDEAVNTSNLNTTNVSVTANGLSNVVLSIKKADGISALGTTEKSVILNLNPATLYTTTVKSRDLTVTFKNLTDIYGNTATTDAVNAVSITKDETKPVVETISHTQNTTTKKSTFLVTLSENVKIDTGVLNAAASLPMVDLQTGVLSNAGVASVDLVDQNGNATTDTSSKYVLVTMDDLLDNGSYNITIPGLGFIDLATSPNKNDAATKAVSITDGEAAAPVSAPVVSTVSQTAGVITVTFDKAVNTTAINPANYKLNGKVLDSDTTITLDSTMKVATITLKDGFVTNDITAPVLYVSGVKSTDGGTLASVYKTVTGGTITETVAPVLTKAEYTAADTVKLYFDEQSGVQLTTGSKVGIYNGATLVATGDLAATEDGSDDDGKLVVTVTTTDEATQNLDALNQGTLTVKIAKDAVLDDNNNPIAATTVSLTDVATTISGTLAADYNSTNETFNLTLATPTVEAGSTAYVYLVGSSDAAVTTDNYANYTPVTIQSAANLSSGAGITFATAKDSFGAALASPVTAGAYKAYVVVKDAAGNVVDVNALGVANTVTP